MPVMQQVWTALRFSGLPFVLRHALQRRNVTVLCLHDPEPEVLSRQLDALAKRYSFIALSRYTDALRSGNLEALPHRALAVTFDDGHRGNFALLDACRAHDVVPTVFLASSIVGTDRAFWWTQVPGGVAGAEHLKGEPDAARVAALEAAGHSETEALPERSALSGDELRAMDGAFDLQSHTRLHPILSRCSDDRAWDEIAGAKAELEGRFGLRVTALAYPNGTAADWGEREASFAQRAGYRCAFSAMAGVNGAGTDPFRIHRIVIPDDASPDEAVVRSSLAHAFLKRLF